MAEEKIDFNMFAKQIQDEETLIYLGGEFLAYRDGKYSPLSQSEIRSLIKKALGDKFSIHARNEVLASLEGDAFIRHDSLNIPEHLINLQNGLLNLSTFEILAHDKQYHFLTQTNCGYTAGATCPLWIKFLGEVLGDDPKKIDVLQEFFGYCLSPLTTMEKSLMLLGEGANGKSVALNVLRGIFGDENCCSVQMENFNNRNYLAEFFSKMVNISTETNTKAHVYEARFKELVSGEKITADRKYGHPFQFKNSCKLAFAFNELPRIDDKSNAFYRRILPLPFNVQFPEDRQDKELSQKLLAEKSGILLWAIDGLKRLRQQKVFTHATSVKTLIETYKKENNNVLCFVEECCVLSSNKLSKSSLYKAYVAFCKDNGFQSQSMINFGKNLRRAFPQIEDYRASKGRLWSGISFQEHDPEEIAIAV